MTKERKTRGEIERETGELNRYSIKTYKFLFQKQGMLTERKGLVQYNSELQKQVL
jgi:hypothetical protein